MKKNNIIPLLLIAYIMNACTTTSTDVTNSDIQLLDPKKFETSLEGKATSLYVLKNKNGMLSEITNYGARVVSLWAKDKNGTFEDVVLGHDNIEAYLDSNDAYFGSAIGRNANRIAKGKFSIDEQEYEIEVNNGPNSLHSGNTGFHKVVWDAKQIDDQTLELHYLAKDGEGGYPGNLNVKLVYKLTDNNELKVEYWATTDKKTIANFTHHSYFNLKGAGKGTITDHIMHINADSYTPYDETCVPTGMVESVANTPLDFRTPTLIGERINSEFEQTKIGYGYDHNWVLNKSETGLNYAIKLESPQSGRILEVETNQIGIQFYSGNYLENPNGKHGQKYGFREALNLETQSFPDSPNQENFPKTFLLPGEEYYSVCIYRLSVQ